MNVTLARNIPLKDETKYSIFYDLQTLAELWVFLFPNGSWHLKTEWETEITGENKHTFKDVLNSCGFTLI